ncbi:MAG TPA: response regulator transcription factor [Puia sp.]
MTQNNSFIKLSIVDDHKLFRKAIVNLIQLNEGERNYTITIEAANGNEFIEKLTKLNKKKIPDIAIVDINMPEMDGFMTVKWLKKNHPRIKILVMSMFSDDATIIRMLKMGASGYLTKDIEPEDLQTALNFIAKEGFYYPAFITAKVIHSLNNPAELLSDLQSDISVPLTDREKEFIKLICTELTYLEIANKMQLSPRTIDGYREALFMKLGLRTRVGLVLWAIKNNLVSV